MMKISVNTDKDKIKMGTQIEYPKYYKKSFLFT